MVGYYDRRMGLWTTIGEGNGEWMYGRKKDTMQIVIQRHVFLYQKYIKNDVFNVFLCSSLAHHFFIEIFISFPIKYWSFLNLLRS